MATVLIQLVYFFTKCICILFDIASCTIFKKIASWDRFLFSIHQLCVCPWCRASELHFTARGGWFNPRCAQFGSRSCHVKFCHGMICTPSESNCKLLTYNALKIKIQPEKLVSDSYALKKYAKKKYINSMTFKFYVA